MNMEGSAENNAVLFSLTLWIDADGDGMPAGWEAANGFSDDNASDAAVDADADGSLCQPAVPHHSGS